MNEFELIESIAARLGARPGEVEVPLGDDCAVVRLGGSRWALASDMLVFGHHFKGWAAPEDVGYKAVAVNVSDVAADLDLAGTMGISEEVPVGFERIRVGFEIDAPGATEEELAALREKTERYCVVMQTLLDPPRIETRWG